MKIKPGERSLFGTDGIRGVAGEFPLDAATVRTIGRALGRSVAREHGTAEPRVVIGEDTRESSRGIAQTLAAGLVSSGAQAQEAGVITTPGVAYLARTGAFAAGIVISASHNPWRDNGIKVFAHDGYKLPDSVELELEREIFSLLAQTDRQDSAAPSGGPAPEPRLHQAYLRWLAGHWHGKRARFRIVADCANGAAAAIAPELFAAPELAEAIQAEFTHASPDGKNINQECGALHPEVVAREVLARGADLGITFDGDADRCLLADARGKVVNGDAIMLLTARWLKAQGRLRDDTVVATTMSNMGLEAALRSSGIRMLRAAVGDKYVLEEMRKTGAVLGGEQSGHIIFRDGDSTTGDGLLTALRVLEIVAASGRPLHELVADLRIFPQIIQNIRVREKTPLAEVPAVAAAIARAERDLDGSGRVVVRYSGTESLARVMVEAASEEQMKQHAGAIAEAIQNALGA